MFSICLRWLNSGTDGQVLVVVLCQHVGVGVWVCYDVWVCGGVSGLVGATRNVTG